jgi:endonuclease-8
MEHPFLRRAGLDVLHDEVTVERVAERFKDARFRRRMLASLLLDQQFLAGLGNYLRSEILFVAGVFPRRRPADCDETEIRALAEAAVRLPRRSYETGGIVTPQALVEELKARGVKKRGYRFWVFGRDEKPCYECGTLIIRDEMGSRRIYYCPSCQPAG